MLFKSAETEVQIHRKKRQKIVIMHYNDQDSITLRGANISVPYEMLRPVDYLY